MEGHLPKAPHLASAGADAKPVLSGAMDEVYKARTREATPGYEAVVNKDSVLNDAQFAPIAESPFLAEQIQIIKSSKLHDKLAKMPDNSLPVLDALKKSIDGQIQAAKKDPALRWEVSELERHRNVLLGADRFRLPGLPESADGI